MPELISQLTACEREKFHEEQVAKKKLRSAEAAVTKASQELMELQRAQEQALRVAKAKQENRLRDVAYQCKLSLHRAIDDRAEAEVVAETAEKRQNDAEAFVAGLEVRLQDLQATLQMRTSNAEQRLRGLEAMMAARLDSARRDAERRVASMDGLAHRVHQLAAEATQANALELQGQAERAHARAECRLRFQELLALAKEESTYDLTPAEYYAMKQELALQWLRHSAALADERSARVPLGPDLNYVAPRHEMLAIERTLPPEELRQQLLS